MARRSKDALPLSFGALDPVSLVWVPGASRKAFAFLLSAGHTFLDARQ
jgi:hypothetical protein